MQRRVDAVVDECRQQTIMALRATDECRQETNAAVRLSQEAISTAANRRDRNAVMKALRDVLTILVGPCQRRCWICMDLCLCQHREPELIERWQQGHLL
jgi:hypothetical protein